MLTPHKFRANCNPQLKPNKYTLLLSPICVQFFSSILNIATKDIKTKFIQKRYYIILVLYHKSVQCPKSSEQINQKDFSSSTKILHDFSLEMILNVHCEQ